MIDALIPWVIETIYEDIRKLRPQFENRQVKVLGISAEDMNNNRYSSSSSAHRSPLPGMRFGDRQTQYFARLTMLPVGEQCI